MIPRQARAIMAASEEAQRNQYRHCAWDSPRKRLIRNLDVIGTAIPGPRVRAPRTMSVAYPRPTNGILLAMTVMNSTLASSGRLAI